MELPPTYVDLATASKTTHEAFVSIIGVVIDNPMFTVSKTKQHVLTFRLLDKSLQYALKGEEGLTVRFFRVEKDQLPKIRNIGDVVLLRNIKMITFNGPRLALSNYQTEHLLFAGGKGIPDPNFGIAFKDKHRLECYDSSSPLAKDKLNLAEQSYVMQINQEMRRAVEDRVHVQETRKTQSIDEVSNAVEPPAKRQKPIPTGPSAPSKKFRKIEQLRENLFSDLWGLVVKKSQENYGCDLYITDYTSNDALRYYAPPEEDLDLQRDGDEFGHLDSWPKKAFPGPYGHQVLKVNVKRPHADFVLKYVHEGDCIELRNVRPRMTTWSGNVFLEGDMWPDWDKREQINAHLVKNMTDPVVAALLSRKEKYDLTRKKLDNVEEKTEEAKKDISIRGERAAKKAAKKAAKREAAKSAKEDVAATDKPASKSDRNQHIRCSHEEVSITGIKDILDPDNTHHTNTLPDNQGSYVLPFVNVRYRAKVRVVDFFPKNLAEFAAPIEPESAAEDDYDSMNWQYSNGTPSHEWYFSLTLEDASGPASPMSSPSSSRIQVHLQHDQAQFLLGNEVSDPEDLKQNSLLLGKLREKLFVLWGNLEEKKEDEELSNLPFECCIMEYGIEKDDTDPKKAETPEGWRRMYAMFGTTIL